MTIQDLISALGGASAVAAELAVTPSAVTNWYERGEIPRRHHLAMWRLALGKGVDWQPDGAEEIRGRLLAQAQGIAA